jgi:uncharacterized MAPEG superfamily protein
MRWPLVLFALLVVLLQALASAPGGQGAVWERAASAARHVFIPFAAAALLMIAFGKPTLPAQYSAWALVMLQVVHAGVVAGRQAAVERALHLLSLGLVAYLWINLMPVFDRIPA